MCPIRNQHSLDRLEMARWESVPRSFSACAWELLSRLFSRPDWPPPGLRGWFTQRSDINLKSRVLSRKADLSCQCPLLPSAPVTWGCQREGKALILKKSLKIQNVLRPWNQILAYKTMLWMSVVRTFAWCFHILEMSSIHTGEHTNVLNASAESLRYFTERPLTTVVTLFFAGSYERFSFRHAWFLICASLKVRPRADVKDVSQDSCCFFGL